MNTEALVKNIISKHKGVRKQQIARELNLGLDYVDLVCQDLKRKGEIAFRDGLYSLITADYKSPKRRTRVIHRKHKQKNPISNIYTKSALSSIPEMTKELTRVLRGAGYKTIESLADAPITRLMQETKLKLHEAAGLINQARKALNKI